MKAYLVGAACAALLTLSSGAWAQDHQHDGGTAKGPETKQQEPSKPCSQMMGCMEKMQGHSGLQSSGAAKEAAAAPEADTPEATKAYRAAMDKMHAPMTGGVSDPDPDVAFMKGMI